MFGLSTVSWSSFLLFAITLLCIYNAVVFVYFKFIRKGSSLESEQYAEEKFSDEEL